MPETKVFCPECDATVRVARDHPPGKRVRCPKCDTQFRPRMDDYKDDNRTASARRGARRRDDDYEADRPSRRSGARRSKQKSNAPLVIGLVAAGVLLLGGVAAAVVILSADKTDDPVVAKGPDPAATRPKGPAVNPAKGLGPASGQVGLNVGDTAPEIDGEDLDSQRFKLSDYRGKVVLLDFWGHW